MFENKTKADLIEMIQAKDEQISQLSETVAALSNENGALKDALVNKPKPVSNGGLSGWLVVAPNPAYNGITCGYQFRNGKAFIAKVDGVDFTAVIRQLRGDFGYQVQEVDNYLAMAPDMRQQVEKSMIDVLGVPTIA